MGLYRIESQRLKSGEIYYLVKDVKNRHRSLKARIRIGNDPPNEEESLTLTSKPNIDLERKALVKRLEMSGKRYRVKYLGAGDLRRLEETRHWEELFKLFLTPSEGEYFEDWGEIEYVHGTTAIEGNTFTAQQVDDLLNKGVTPTGKSLREINEVQNYVNVKEYRDRYRGRVTQAFIRRLHGLVMDKIDRESPGMFRRIDGIGIRGLDAAVTPAILIETELGRIIGEYYANIRAGAHPFEEAVAFHYGFEMIHPFLDGNGRVGREVLNYMLTRSGYPRIIFTKSRREGYIDALRLGNEGRFEDMVPKFIDLLIDKRADTFQDILSGRIAA